MGPVHCLAVQPHCAMGQEPLLALASGAQSVQLVPLRGGAHDLQLSQGSVCLSGVVSVLAWHPNIHGASSPI